MSKLFFIKIQYYLTAMKLYIYKIIYPYVISVKNIKQKRYSRQKWYSRDSFQNL